MTNPATAKRYVAFLSYSHRDEVIARWLHRQLEHYRLPSRLIGKETSHGLIGKRLGKVFRDREELPSGHDLAAKVQVALAESEFLIVVCSPDAARSRWVNEEILAWKRLGREQKLLCLIVAGEPGLEADECFAPALRWQLGADGEPGTIPAEPIAADLRPGKDGKRDALLKLISGLLDVGLDDLKQRDQQRRHRLLAVGLTAAIGIAVLTSALAIKAVIASEAAQRRQKQAEDLVNFMLGDLGDKLTEVSRLDIMEKVNEQAMSYFRSLPPDDVTDEALAQRARTLAKIGNVRGNQGEALKAREAFDASLALSKPLAERNPGIVAFQTELAETLNWIGFDHWHRDEIDQALVHFNQAITVLDRASALAPDDDDLSLKLSWTLNNTGHVHQRRGDLAAARRDYERMLSVNRRLAAAQPDKRQWQIELADSHEALGELALLRGELELALREYIEDEAIRRRLCQQDPLDFEAKSNHAIALAVLARMLMLAGAQEPALQRMAQGLALLADNVANDPGNGGYRSSLVRYRSEYGAWLRWQGKLEPAMRLNDEVLSFIQQGIDQNPEDPIDSTTRRRLAEAKLERVRILSARGEEAAARSLMAAVLEAATTFEAAPDMPRDVLLFIAQAGLQQALFERQDRRQNGSRARAASALAALDRHAPGTPDPQLMSLRCLSLLLLGRADEAAPLIAALSRTGYRAPDFVTALAEFKLDYLADSALVNRITALLRTAE